MPRKATNKTGAGIAAPSIIQCPACQSRISGDGSALHAKSKYFDELLETAGSIEEVEKAADALEKKNQEYKVRIAQLEAELKNEKEKKPNVEAQGSGKPKSGDSWW